MGVTASKIMEQGWQNGRSRSFCNKSGAAQEFMTEQRKIDAVKHAN
jgi:hypothetical protein